MRFLLKMTFLLGLIAFFIPFGDRPKEANISMMGAFIGAQQAIADLTGFCDRAPQACDTGRELAVFAGERIGDGVAMAYSLVQDKIESRDTEAHDTAVAAVAGPTDPVTTGAVAPVALPEAVKGPMPYLAPKRTAPVEEAADVVTEAPQTVAARPRSLAIPTPAPRL
jgi:hypothetical protein